MTVPSFSTNDFEKECDMAEITAKMVNELRAKTGQPMMECKKMLEKTGGDMNSAMDEFRKKGVKSSLPERAASEGRVLGGGGGGSKVGGAGRDELQHRFHRQERAVHQAGDQGGGDAAEKPERRCGGGERSRRGDDGSRAADRRERPRRQERGDFRAERHGGNVFVRHHRKNRRADAVRRKCAAKNW